MCRIVEIAEPHILPVCPGIHIYRRDTHTPWKIVREARPRETSPKHKDVAAHYMGSVCVEVCIMRGGKGTKDDRGAVVDCSMVWDDAAQLAAIFGTDP